MKNKNRLFKTAIMLIGIVITTNLHAQTLNYVPKWDGIGSYIDTATPIFEDAANSRIGIGTLLPSFKLDVIDDINITPTATNFINDGYRINNRMVLYIPGDNLGWNNTFVGQSGNPTLAAPGIDDTYVGFNAGLNTSSAAQQNVFVGVGAGQQINATTGATYIGFEAGRSNSVTGGSDFNTFVGWKSGWSDVSSGANAYLGRESGYSNQNGSWNTFLGAWAGYATTVGYNTFVGALSGRLNTIATHNTFLGWNSGFANTVNGRNTFVGSDVASVNPSGEDNTFVGALSGKNNQGNYNSYLGTQAGYSLTNGSYNTLIGYISGYYNQSNANSFLGSWSGEFHNSGDYNTYIGYQAQFVPTSTADPLNNLTHSAAIGTNAIVTGDDQMILGGVIGARTVNVGIGLSGITPGPRNLLEINAINFTGAFNDVDELEPNPCGPGATGFSGLQFRDLTSNSKPCPSNKLALSVDNIGNVILVPEIGGGGLGNDCINPQNPLTGNYEIPTNGNNFYFSPFAGTITPCSDNVGIGMVCGNNYIYAKLHVLQSVTCSPHGLAMSEAGRFDNRAGGWLARGILGEVTNAAAINEGVYGYVPVAGTPGTVSNAIVGDLGVAPLPPCPAFPCPPITAPDAAGYFNGDLVSTTAVYTVSDASLKENIHDIIDPMDIINKLNPKSYTFDSKHQSMQLASGIRYGLLSQEVEKVLPGLVKNCVHSPRFDSEGKETHPAINYKALNYTELIPFLVAGMKEQQNQIEDLKNMLNNCCLSNSEHQLNKNNTGENPIGTIELKSGAAFLYQNQPNPFDNSTVIRYFIPDNGGSAKIIFMDETGKTINEAIITEKGMGSLNVISSELANGIYTYSLQIDGKILDTKKMLKTK